MSRQPPRHQLVDHTSEIVLEIHAPDFPELMKEAARGFVGLVPQRLWVDDDPRARRIRLSGRDRPRLLVDWLNELVYLAETECWIPTEVGVSLGPDGEGREGDASEIVIEARGIRLRQPFVKVKAATLHDLRFDENADGLQAEVTLDV